MRMKGNNVLIVVTGLACPLSPTSSLLRRLADVINGMVILSLGVDLLLNRGVGRVSLIQGIHIQGRLDGSLSFWSSNLLGPLLEPRR